MNIHCATHRMNFTDAGDVAGSQPIQNLTQLLNKSYWFWVKRPRDVMKMRRLASYFGQKRPLTLKQHADTSWLGFLKQSIGGRFLFLSGLFVCRCLHYPMIIPSCVLRS